MAQDGAAAEAPATGEVTAEHLAALETLSVNLARAALTAQGAVTEAALMQAGKGAPADADPLQMQPVMTQIAGKLAEHPEKLLKAQAGLFEQYMELWRRSSLKLLGGEVEPVVQPAKGDKRFNDPDWSAHPVFDVMKQSYLLSANWLNELVGQVEGVDPLTKRRAEFFVKMMTDAVSPSNFLLSNPQALRTAVETKGESLVKGMERLASDLERGHGELAITQADYAKFEVGVNVATAPGKVVFQNDIIQLIQFSPSTEQVHEVPLLIFPPWINKFYIMDLKPSNSLIRWLVGQGFTVFVAAWVNPSKELANKTFEDYLREGVYAAVEQVLKQTGQPQTNTVGYCIGGTMLGSALAHMAARGVDSVKSATFYAAQHDFSEAGDLLIFTNEAWLKEIEARMDAAGGVLPGRVMGDTFNALRANDLIWQVFVNNYLLGKDPPAFDLLFWNADQTRMPKALHLFYLRHFYKDNELSKGELVLDGVRLNLGDVKVPVYLQSSREDHIAPFRSVYKSTKLFGGDVTFMLAGSGHIAGVINPPSSGKYQHWVNPQIGDTPDEWLAGAEERPGSWWPHWAEWLRDKSGPLVPARDPAAGPLTPIEDAPGSFVRVKS